jgi:AraC-like DNA-binding protein
MYLCSKIKQHSTMYDQLREDTLYIMLYAAVTTTAMLTSCYLLFRRGNAIAPGVTPPARLRRWAALFLAVFALNHVWYMPIFFLSSSEDIMMIDLIGGLLDSMTFFPLMIVVMLMMLQDRRRPMWPVAVMFAPLVVGNAWCVAVSSYALLPMLYLYFLLMCIGLVIYIVRALRQYGRWLRDNYADLEHKEVWQSFVVLAIVLLVFVAYTLIYEGLAYQYAMLVVCAMLICYLPWRVETLSDLSIPIQTDMPVEDVVAETAASDSVEDSDLSLSMRNRSTSVALLVKNIESLLKQHCEDPQLYLQYDISLPQLAKIIGTNRLYLSQYFSCQGITYNAYINGLRIQHFIRLYQETIANSQPVSAQKLAYQSGFRSYNTFSVAFKKMKGMTVTEWTRRPIST